MTELPMPMEATISRSEALELDRLQTALVHLQNRVKERNERVVVVFEGRDTAGKGGAILRFMRYLDPRATRAVALPKPTERQRSQWYFQRYVQNLPAGWEIVLFDRSWYNRAVIEPVLGFCTPEEYDRFMLQVPRFEQLLIDDGIHLIKLWFSIDKETQARRLESRRTDVRRQWKLSPVDGFAQERWDEVTRHKELMYARTHRPDAPWVIVQGQDKYLARTESMRYVLRRLGAQPLDEDQHFEPDPAVVHEYDGPLSP